MSKSTKCYDVFLSADEKHVIIEERYSLYSVPDVFFDRLSNPSAAKHFHKQEQKAWLADEYTRMYETKNEILYMRFLFDAKESEYDDIANSKWYKVKINE